MKLIMAIIRPSKLEDVKEALGEQHISGMTVTDVRGHGRQRGKSAIYRGQEYQISLLPKVMIQVVVDSEAVENAIRTIVETARTGEIGDGRVFVLPVDESYNIRTGEVDR